MAISLPMAAPGMACAPAPVQTLPPLLPTAFPLHTLCGSSPFLYFLSAQVFDRDLVHLHSFAGGGDLLLCQTLIGIVLHRKPLDKRQRLRPALKQAAAAKHDRALHIRRPRLIADDLIAQDSEAHLIAGSERIDLVSRARAVEVDLPHRFIVEVVDRYGVGVTIMTLCGKSGNKILRLALYMVKSYNVDIKISRRFQQCLYNMIKNPFLRCVQTQ